MTKETRLKVLAYLETIQIDSLQDRFGNNYENEFREIQKLLQGEFNFESYFASQPSMTEIQKNEIRAAFGKLKTLKPITKYQDIQSYTALEKLFKRIQTTANAISLKTPSIPIFGTAYSREWNAFAERVPETTEYLIVLEAELFTLSNLLAKIIASCLPDFKISSSGVSFSFEKHRIINHVNNSPALQQRFYDLVHNAIYLGQPNNAKQYFLEEPFGRLQYILLNSLELFVVGHEYGHIQRGHLSHSKVVANMRGGKNQVQRIVPEWEMEYEADSIGLLLLLYSIGSDSLLPFDYLGPELFFTFLDIGERANSLYHSGKEKRSLGSEDHPPTFERRNRIRQLLKVAVPPDHLESYQYASEFLENVFETLWDNFKKNKTG